jgi:hypothetical protein
VTAPPPQIFPVQSQEFPGMGTCSMSLNNCLHRCQFVSSKTVELENPHHCDNGGSGSGVIHQG